MYNGEVPTSFYAACAQLKCSRTLSLKTVHRTVFTFASSLTLEARHGRLQVLSSLNFQINKKEMYRSTSLFYMVGMTRLELATPRPPDVCATKLRYIPLQHYYSIKISAVCQ